MQGRVNLLPLPQGMAQSYVAINDVLVAVSGSDDDLARELRSVLLGRAMTFADMLKDAHGEAEWALIARRLESLAASFCAHDLHRAAQAAAQGAPFDAAALRKINRAISRLHL